MERISDTNDCLYNNIQNLVLRLQKLGLVMIQLLKLSGKVCYGLVSMSKDGVTKLCGNTKHVHKR